MRSKTEKAEHIPVRRNYSELVLKKANFNLEIISYILFLTLIDESKQNEYNFTFRQPFKQNKCLFLQPEGLGANSEIQ